MRQLESRSLGTEGHRHPGHKGVTVEFHPTTYNIGELFLNLIDELADILDLGGLPPVTATRPPRSFLLMDVFAGHTTAAVLNKLRDFNITPSLTPGDCTGLLQPLDPAVNKPFKVYLRDFMNAYVEGKEHRGEGVDS